MQARQAAQFILLNDCVLVATRKKRTMSYKVKLVADRCWPLGEIQVQDIKNTPEVLNTIKVVHFQEVYFFRCERLEDKNAMLIAIQRATAELMDNTKQNEAEASRGVSEPLLQMVNSDISLNWFSMACSNLAKFIFTAISSRDKN
jgi:hypothetical protein